MLLLLSVPLRTYVLFRCSLSRRSFSIFLGETTGDSETSVACIEMLNRHSDRQLIAYSAYAYKSLSLSHVFVSALSTSNIRPLLHLPSLLAHWDLLLSIESRIDGPISRSGSSSFTRLIPIVFSHPSHSCHLSSVFRSLPLVALSSPFYDFGISSTSVSFTRILNISQSTKRQYRNSSEQHKYMRLRSNTQLTHSKISE